MVPHPRESHHTVDISKLNKKQLEKLLHTREVENQELSKKLGECLCLETQGHISLSISEHSRKRRKRLQKALNANQSSHQSEGSVPYPTGEVPG